jgi:hypothetical protein
MTDLKAHLAQALASPARKCFDHREDMVEQLCIADRVFHHAYDRLDRFQVRVERMVANGRNPARWLPTLAILEAVYTQATELYEDACDALTEAQLAYRAYLPLEKFGATISEVHAECRKQARH